MEGQSKLTQDTKKKVINVNNNYVKTTASLNTHTEANLERTTQIPQLWEQNTEVKVENPTSVQTAKAADQSFEIEGLEKLTLESAKDPKKHSMVEVTFSMMRRGGDKLKKLHNADVEGSGYQLNCCSLLAEVAEEHNLNLTYRWTISRDHS